MLIPPILLCSCPWITDRDSAFTNPGLRTKLLAWESTYRSQWKIILESQKFCGSWGSHSQSSNHGSRKWAACSQHSNHTVARQREWQRETILRASRCIRRQRQTETTANTLTVPGIYFKFQNKAESAPCSHWSARSLQAELLYLYPH